MSQLIHHNSFRLPLFSALGRTLLPCLLTGLMVACSAQQETPDKSEVKQAASPEQLTGVHEKYQQLSDTLDTASKRSTIDSGIISSPAVASKGNVASAHEEREAQNSDSNTINNSNYSGNQAVERDRALAPSPTHPGRQQAELSVYYNPQAPSTENYLAVNDNGINRAAENPLSTFSIDVDTAGYSNLRRILMDEGRLPPYDAVRLEEMINYFGYDYHSPESLQQPLAINTELMTSPWNSNNQLLMIGINGFEPPAETRPASNLVFLVDVSGSMQSPDKLGLVKKSLKLLVAQMREEDRMALVVYAGAAGVVLDSTSGDNKAKINSAIDSLLAGGSTHGSAGIELAYRIAEQNKIDDGINRVLIASDGDMNVGITDIDDLKQMISKKRDNGIALTTLGYGAGNYNYSLMEQLADTGNGNAAYIDSLDEARKVLVEEMQSTLLTIAKDVKIQIEFNPQVVTEYRLIGYENRLLEREDFVNDKIDAGEIGAGHTVTALYEITLSDSAGNLIPQRRYTSNETGRTSGQQSDDDHGNELAFVKIRYKLPRENTSTEFSTAVLRQDPVEGNSQVSANIGFAAAVAGFGQLLRGGKYTGDWGYDELLQLARQSRGTDDHGYRSEMIKMVELAKIL